jgi:diguanylate cyclase (GGDEF)-like protein
MKPGLSAALRQLAIPNGVLLLGSALLLQWKLHALFAAPVGNFIPIIGAAVGIMLAWRLRTPRLMLVLVLFLLAAWTWMWAVREPGVRTALTVLLPLNIAVLLLIDDTYVDWEAFCWWAGLVGVQAAVVAVLVATDEASVLLLLRRPLAARFAIGSHVPQLAALVFLICGVGLLIAFFMHRKPRDTGLFWSLCACFLAIGMPSSRLSTGYFAIAGLIAAVSVIETAFLVGYHDELTGLPARRAFNQTIAALDGEYAIAMLDVDHFKRFNDTFGHDAGDQVLRMVASKILNVGGNGKPFRYGGEEFAIVFRRSTAEEALEHLELLRALIADTSFGVRGPDRSRRSRPERRYRHRPRKLRKERVNTRVTVSIGVAEPMDLRMPVEDVLRAADKALYRAKGRGRNRVEISGARRPREIVTH